MANQTTMLKEQTHAFQKQLGEAIIKRDGNDSNYYLFDTICGATQDRQNALYDLLISHIRRGLNYLKGNKELKTLDGLSSRAFRKRQLELIE